MKKPQFEDFPDAVIREGADEFAGRGDLSRFFDGICGVGNIHGVFFSACCEAPSGL